MKSAIVWLIVRSSINIMLVTLEIILCNAVVSRGGTQVAKLQMSDLIKEPLGEREHSCWLKREKFPQKAREPQ